MDFEALRAFLSIVEQRSFSRASAKLYLTQPAISKRIAALEEELGTSLFERVSRQITLTEAGEALLPHARQIFTNIDAGRVAVQDLSKTIGGRLSMGVSHHISLRRIPALLKKYKKEFPNVHLDISFLESEEAYSAVEHGKEEIAFITLPEQIPEILIAGTLWVDNLALVAAKDYPLSHHKKVTLQDLHQYPVILPSWGTFTRALIERQFAKEGISLNTGMETNNFETIRMMTSVGVGWSVLPKTMIDSSFRTFSIPGIELQRKLGYVTHARRKLSNAAKAFIELAKKVG